MSSATPPYLTALVRQQLIPFSVQVHDYDEGDAMKVDFVGVHVGRIMAHTFPEGGSGLVLALDTKIPWTVIKLGTRTPT